MPRGGVTFKWVKPVSNIQTGFTRHGRKALVAVRQAADHSAIRMQNAARAEAPWTDRTGNARSGLFGGASGGGLPDLGAPSAVADIAPDESVEGDETLIVVVIAHSMSYGVSLELDHAELYAVLVPVMDREIPQLGAALKRLTGG